MADYRRNHYVPRWYQERFIPRDVRERKFFYLDMQPESVVTGGGTYQRSELLRWGPRRCFVEGDLYTTRFGAWESTEIEKYFFGEVDSKGRRAVDYFAGFAHPHMDNDAFHDLVRYMSLQKLRTPKGLRALADRVRLDDRNKVLEALQVLQQIHGAIWTESIWLLADASASLTKFIVSDHPVTVYNRGCFPKAAECRGHRDPDISLVGTHTLFPLSLERILILTNLSWVRNPYANPKRQRLNSNPWRTAIFNWTEIQTLRELDEQEVLAINHIVKTRAHRYIAAAEREWLYPERSLAERRWDRLAGDPYLLMPDPRSVSFGADVMFGYEDRPPQIFDELGRRPGQITLAEQEALRDAEWRTFHAFKGEFARLCGPRRRGRSFQHVALDPEEDAPDFHAYHLRLESEFKRSTRRARRRPGRRRGKKGRR